MFPLVVCTLGVIVAALGYGFLVIHAVASHRRSKAADAAQYADDCRRRRELIALRRSAPRIIRTATHQEN